MRTELLKPDIELVRADDPDRKVIAKACGSCGRFVPLNDGWRCCVRKFCDCGKEIEGSGWTICDNCRNRKDREKLEGRKASATKVWIGDYDGVVYWEEWDRFFDDADDVVEYILESAALDDIEVDVTTQTLWCCHSQSVQLYADTIIENALESGEHHEDAIEELSVEAEKSLKEFAEQWNDKHGDEVTTFQPDYKRLLVLSPHERTKEHR